MRLQFARWPKYKENYKRAIIRALNEGGFLSWLEKRPELQYATVEEKANALLTWWVDEYCL